MKWKDIDGGESMGRARRPRSRSGRSRS